MHVRTAAVLKKVLRSEEAPSDPEKVDVYYKHMDASKVNMAGHTADIINM